LDLPTYTNIWRIEKRLYKLYDFRLPMPLPVGQIAVFTAVAVPYVVILKVLGLPFSHTLLWLYILPPGALAWLVTRPVLESKRLPELVVSQLRYLSEPRTWCRMAPLAEKDEIVIAARVWRRVGGEMQAASEPTAAAPAAMAAVVTAGEARTPLPPAQSPPRRTARRRRPAAVPVPARPEGLGPPVREAPAAPVWPDRPARGIRVPAAPAAPAVPSAHQAGRAVPVPAVPDVPAPPQAARAMTAPDPAARGVTAPDPAARGVAAPDPAARGVTAPDPAARAMTAPDPAARGVAAPDQAARAVPAAGRAVSVAAAPSASPARPVVTVTGDQEDERPLRVVERALGRPSERRASGWHDHVVVVPGGHRPGRPDQLQRDRARARLPVRGGHRVVVLGCTVGAGQTVTTLLTAELLASLRGDRVAMLDLNPGEGSLAERAPAVPALTGSRPPAPSRAEVITREAAGAGPGEDLQNVTRAFELLSARYPLTLADPGAAAVPRVLMAADQLVLVAPASRDAASALATTREWLEAHGHAGLADEAITVLNGVSRHTMPHVEQAEALARGRCRAIVRIPWDDHLKNPGPARPASTAAPPAPAPPPHRGAAGSLSPAALHAYTALSGVLIAALAAAPEQLRRVRP
jgi:TcpE family